MNRQNLRLGGWFVAFLIASSSILLTSCLDLTKEAVLKRRFALTTERDPVQATEPKSVLMVRALSASSYCEGRGLTYRTGQKTFASDFYNEYFAPPALLITAEVQEWFLNSGVFGSVIAPGSYAAPTHVLEGEVTEFHGDYLESPGEAVVGLNLIFLQSNQEGRLASGAKLVFQKVFRSTVALSDDGPEALVTGLEQALAVVLRQAEEAVRDARSNGS